MKKIKLVALCALGFYGYLGVGYADDLQPVIAGDQIDVSAEASSTKKPDVHLAVTNMQSSGDSVTASGNTEAAKKYAFGTISVNLPSGIISMDFQTPYFSAMLDLSLSFNSNLYQVQKLSSDTASAFGLPYGMFIKGLPYVHTVSNAGKNYLLVFYGGSDYYVDSSYTGMASCDDQQSNCSDTYKSGLKYQTSKNISFQTKNYGIYLHLEDGTVVPVAYSYVLKYANGATYYFNSAGLCVLVTDRFFEDNKANNVKHAVRFDYLYNDKGPFGNQIKSITDPDGVVLNFKYSGSYLSEIDYPKNASGQAEVMRFNYNSGALFNISKRLDDSFDTGYKIAYDQNGLIYSIDKVLYNRGTFDVARNYVRNQFDYIKATNDNNAYKVSKVDKSIYGGDGSLLGNDRESYTYQVLKTPSYIYGEDVALNNASSYDYTHVATVATQCVGVNCDYEIVHNYNSLGLELLNQSYERFDGDKYRLVAESYNQFSGINDDNKGLDYSLLSANYSQPVASVQLVYNNDEKPVGISKVVNAYDDYGNQYLTKSYPLVSYIEAYQSPKSIKADQGITFPKYPDDIDPAEIVSTAYDGRYQEKVMEDSLDCGVGLNQTDCSNGYEITETTTLTSDGRMVSKQSSIFKKLSTGEQELSPTVSYTYGNDSEPCYVGDNYYNAGLVCSESVYNSDGQKIEKKYSYTKNNHSGYFPELVKTEFRSYVDPTHITDASEATGADQESKGYQLTRSIANQVTEDLSHFVMIGKNGSDVTTELSKITQYNVSGMPVLEKDKQGKVITYDYDFKNMMKSSYLSPTSAVEGDNKNPILQDMVEYDGLGNVVRKYNEKHSDDANKHNYFVVVQNYYDYKEGQSLLKKQVDMLGNYKLYQYDARNRPVLTQTYQLQQSQN